MAVASLINAVKENRTEKNATVMLNITGGVRGTVQERTQHALFSTQVFV
ncbi:MAG: hypothetical protein MZV63_19290 [Marinilabiliales bacterium]|nr:hypothetical protein [Marinilabiliales bacterium]